jgi:hypothetical protein
VATANEGLTVAGSAFALASIAVIVFAWSFEPAVLFAVASSVSVVLVVVRASSIVDSATTRSICFFVTRGFGVRPHRIAYASIVASNFVWCTQNSDPAAAGAAARRAVPEECGAA